MKISLKLDYDEKSYVLIGSSYDNTFASITASLSFSQVPEAIIDVFRQRRCFCDNYSLRILKKAKLKLGEDKINSLESLVRIQDALGIAKKARTKKETPV